MIDKLLK